eukprot:5659278-Alexandrium_andersonii.AAC.1
MWGAGARVVLCSLGPTSPDPPLISRARRPRLTPGVRVLLARPPGALALSLHERAPDPQAFCLGPCPRWAARGPACPWARMPSAS